MKILLKIAEITVFLVIIAILFIAASPILPTKDIISSYVITSGSMEPTIMTGSLVLTRGIDPSSIQKDDVITFTQPTDNENIVVHRVIEKTGGDVFSFQTKGDNNDAVDQWTVMPGHIKGNVAFSIPYIGYIISWLKTPLGFAIGMGIPALLLVALQIKKIFKGIHEEVEKRTREAISKHSEHASMIALLILVSGMLFTSHTGYANALFSAQATMTGFSLTVSTETPTPTPSVTITPSISPTVTPTPSTNPNGNCADVEISGTGAGSTNAVHVNCENTTIINQNSSTQTSTTIIQSTNTGDNSQSGNTNSSSTIVTESSSSTTNVSVTADEQIH